METYYFAVYSPAEYDEEIAKKLLEKTNPVFACIEYGKRKTHKHLNLVYKGCHRYVFTRLKLKMPLIKQKKCKQLENVINYLTKEDAYEILINNLPEPIEFYIAKGKSNEDMTLKTLDNIGDIVHFYIWYCKLTVLEYQKYFPFGKREGIHDYAIMNNLLFDYTSVSGTCVSKYQRDLVLENIQALAVFIQQTKTGTLPIQRSSPPWLCEERIERAVARERADSLDSVISRFVDEVLTPSNSINDSAEVTLSRKSSCHGSPRLRRGKRRRRSAPHATSQPTLS